MKFYFIVFLFSLFYLNGSAQDYYFERYDSLDQKSIFSILVESDNHKYVSTYKGIVKIFDQFSSPDTVSSNGAYSMAKDSKGNVWLGLINGELKNLKQGVSYPVIDRPDNIINAVESFSNGMYVGMEDKLVKVSFERESNEEAKVIGIKHIEVLDKFGRINALFTDKNKETWIGTDNGLFKMSNGIKKDKITREAEIHVTDILENNGSLWITGKDGVWYYKNFEVWLKPEFSRNISGVRLDKLAFDQLGKLWIGGEKLFYCEGLDCEVFGPDNGFLSKRILSMEVDKANVLWVGTDGKGLFYAQLDTLENVHFEKPLALEELQSLEGENDQENAIPMEYKNRYQFMGESPFVNLILLLDISNSMGTKEKWEKLKASVKGIVDKMRPEDQISIITFTRRGELVLPVTTCVNTETIHATLDSLKTKGGSQLQAGIQMAYDYVKSNKLDSGNNRIILATDGLFTIYKPSYMIVKDGKKNDITMSVFHFSKNQNADLMDLVQKGGGTYNMIWKPTQNLFDVLATEVKAE